MRSLGSVATELEVAVIASAVASLRVVREE
jgi:hypothetical protein